MALTFKNNFAASQSNLDIQRGDLFYVSINLPAAVTGGTGASSAVWDANVGFAVTKFPLPERTRKTIPVKWLNQTNHMLGAEDATAAFNVEVRYVFAQQTAKLLESWHWMTSNPSTGGSALTSVVKTTGQVYFLIPNMSGVTSSTTDTTTVPDINTGGVNAVINGGDFLLQPVYFLEGVMITGLKISDLDSTADQNLVSLQLKLTVDRYYPLNLNSLQLGTPAVS